MAIKIIDLNVMIAISNQQAARGMRDALARLKPKFIATPSDNKEAAALMEQRAFNFFMIDDSFPDIGGLDFVRFIRMTDSAATMAPILYGLNSPDKSAVIAARNAGVNKIVAMPLSAGAFMEHIHSVLGGLRPFVQSDNYVGPCRRNMVRPYPGADRRIQQGTITNVEQLEKRLLPIGVSH